MMNKLISPLYFPPGHFYSPYPDLNYIKLNQEKIFEKRLIKDVNLNEKVQLEYLNKIIDLYPTMNIPQYKDSNYRYFFENPAYSYGDAISLNGMLRIIKPNKVIEVGSGYSSCMILDTNEVYFNNSISCLFCEPYPELLKNYQ